MVALTDPRRVTLKSHVKNEATAVRQSVGGAGKPQSGTQLAREPTAEVKSLVTGTLRRCSTPLSRTNRIWLWLTE